MSVAPHEPHGDDHGHGHGSPFIQHHYDDAQHQFDSGKLGIWLFLAQEVLFFSALFVAYILYRVHHPEVFSYAHKWLQVKYGAINTAVLIFSSLTAAWAVRCAQLGQRKRLLLCLATTLACALTFLGIKYIEYSHKYHEHILFGRYFDPCISPGGVELLTKNNECRGTKSTIDWDFGGDAPGLADPGKAKSGCFDIAKIDQDPATPGIQASCKVTERKVEVVKGADGKIVDKKVVSSRDIPERCPPWHLPEAGGEAEHVKFPCWKPAFQPAVCGDKQAGILVEYGDEEERGEDIAIAAECAAPPAAKPAGDAFADNTQALALGQKSIAPAHQETTEEEHEIEAAGPPPQHTNMFFSIYFAMTGLHGIHVLVGVLVFIWLLIRAAKGHFTPEYFGPIDFAALYWHIVDLIWIFLFPLLYLIH